MVTEALFCLMLLATSFRLFTHVLLCLSVCPWVYVFLYRSVHFHCDIEEAMVALLKTLSPLQTIEVKNIQETSRRHHKMIWYFLKARLFLKFRDRN